MDPEHSFSCNPPKRGEKRLVLVVDPYTDNLLLLVQVLDFLGCNALTANSMAIALTLANAQRFDLILTELFLPGMESTDLVAQLRRAAQATPIIVITSWVSTKFQQQAEQAGCNAYLEKPYQLEQLEALIIHYLSLPSPSPSPSQP